MNFSEARFPEDISYGSRGGPQFSTELIISKGGVEQRNSNWSVTRSKYNVAHCIKNIDQLSKLISFFRSHMGKAIGFRFKDWTDYTAEKQVLKPINKEEKTFQLIKIYKTTNGPNHYRTIYKPVEGTVKIYSDNVEITKNCEINYKNGLIKINQKSEIKQDLKASFEFDIPARFDTDHLSSSIDNFNAYSWKNINIIETIPWDL